MNDPPAALAAAIAAAFGIATGLVVGSFLATLAIRWPAGVPVSRGRSRCDGCGAPVRGARLAPLVGFLALRGRAACCGMRIDPRQPLMEAGCALIGGAALWLRPDAAGLAAAASGWLLAVLALLDRDHLWLPDRLVLPLALLGLGGGLAGIDPPLADRLAGGAAGWSALAALAGLYRRLRGREGLGQGDAKLLGAIGLWLGWRPLPWVVLGASLLGIGWVGLARARGRAVRRDDALPLGTLLAIAAGAAWLWTAAA